MKYRIAIIVLFAAGAALAVSPGTWVHKTEADFSKGEFEHTGVTSLGQVILAREITILLGAEDAPAVVSAVVVGQEAIYAADGSDNKIYRVPLVEPPDDKQAGAADEKLADKKAEDKGKAKGEEGDADQPARNVFAELPSTMIVSLRWAGGAFPKGHLLAGTAGEKAGIYRIDADGKVESVWTDPKVKYVWAIAPGDKGVLYAATGPEGKVFAIDAAGKGEVVFDAELSDKKKLAKNILCLVRSDKGLLYAGTDEKGLVIEIDPAKKTSRILMDAAEKEIAAILLDGEGGLFVATSEAARARGDGAAPPNGAKAGRPVKIKPARPKPTATRPAGPTTKPARKDKGASAGARQYRVAKGEAGFWGIAKKVYGEGKYWPLIARANPDVDPNALKVGQKLVIPAVPKKAPTTRPAARTLRPRPKPRNGSGPMPRMVRRMMMRRPSPRPGRGARPSGSGNAVYHIDSKGLVRTIFRRPVTILAMLRRGDRLLLGTGNGGDIYSVTIDGSEIVRLVDTEASQITTLAAGPVGRLIFGSANKGSVGFISGKSAAEGTFTSKALDAKQVAAWGTLKVRAAVPRGAKLTVATRSGNVAQPDEKTWSDWSKEWPVAGAALAGREFFPIGSPAGRFIQYRLTLTARGDETPGIDGVQIMYLVPNLAPTVAGVIVQPSAKGAGPPAASMVFRNVAIRAADPNGDSLEYRIEFRRIGTAAWIEIEEKHRQPKYSWDTRKVGDGRYEIRITASDKPSNPPASALTASRISDPIVVDNAPPVFRNVAARAIEGAAEVAGNVADASSRIVSIHYAVDSQKAWVALQPSDGICDSPAEKFTFRADDLKPGAHRIAVKAVDLYGNVGYGAVTVTVAKGAAD